MTRHGPPNRSGPRSGRKLRVAGEHSHSRSDAGRASPTSHSPKSLSPPTAPGILLVDTALTVVLNARGRSRFDAFFGGTQIVKASKNPISDAARILYRQSYSDDRLLLARHAGAKHDAMHGPLGQEAFPRVCTFSGRAGHGSGGGANGAPLTCLQRTHTVRVEEVVVRQCIAPRARVEFGGSPPRCSSSGQF